MKSPKCPECGTTANYFAFKIYNPWKFMCRGCGTKLKVSALYTILIWAVGIASAIYAIQVGPYIESGQWSLLTEYSYYGFYLLLIVLIGRIVWSYIRLNRWANS